MTPRATAKTALAFILAAGVSTVAQAGFDSVDPIGPVFVPPVLPLPGATATAPAPAPQAGGAAATETATPAEVAAENEQSARATRAFNDAQFFCARLSEAEYRVDCLADQLAQYAASLPETPEFAEVRAVVATAATRLNDVARRNASGSKRPGRLREASGAAPRTSSRAIVPVATERLETAFDLAGSILREAETQLLRAAEQSERRQVAFSEIAAAVGGSTILLRSS